MNVFNERLKFKFRSLVSIELERYPINRAIVLFPTNLLTSLDKVLPKYKLTETHIFISTTT